MILYRAKSGDKVVIGYYVYDEVHKRHLILTNGIHGLIENRIDIDTLAIHIPNIGMYDENDNKLFAAVYQDKESGDRISCNVPARGSKELGWMTNNQELLFVGGKVCIIKVERGFFDDEYIYYIGLDRVKDIKRVKRVTDE